MSSRPVTHKPFALWPGEAQLAFEKYYALDGKDRSIDTAALLGGISVTQMKRWSSRWGFAAEIDRRDRALAEEARAKVLSNRRRVIEAAESGVGALIIRYSAAAQGKCPVCIGKGMILKRELHSGKAMVESVCPRCLGESTYDPMSLNMLAFDRALTRYGVMTGDLSDPADGPGGTLSHEEWVTGQREMLERAGGKVARLVGAMRAGEEPGEPGE